MEQEEEEKKGPRRSSRAAAIEGNNARQARDFANRLSGRDVSRLDLDMISRRDQRRRERERGYLDSEGEEDDEEHAAPASPAEDEAADEPTAVRFADDEEFPDVDDLKQNADDTHDAFERESSKSADEPGVAGKIIFMDVEFAALDADSPVCQIAAFSMDLQTVVFNRYSHAQDLHPFWMHLINHRGVTMDRWDDPKCARFDEVFLSLLECCPAGAILLFKGVVDVRRCCETLAYMDPPASPGRLAKIHSVARDKNILFASVEELWREVAMLLPGFAREHIFAHAAAKQSRPLHTIYDNLFHRPILIHVRDGEDEQVVNPRFSDSIHASARVQFVRLETNTPRTEPERVAIVFLLSQHHQPAFHTAHTDALVMRNITHFLLLYAQVRAELLALILAMQAPKRVVDRADHGFTAEQVAFFLLATFVVRQSTWFRDDRHIFVTEEGAAYAWTILTAGSTETLISALEKPVRERKKKKNKDSSEASTSTIDEDRTETDLPSEPPAAAAAAAAAPRKKNPNTSKSITKARKLRMEGNEHIVVEHDGEWMFVYAPRMRGSDAFKVRALVSLVKVPELDMSIFQKLEDTRALTYPNRQTTSIGMRPWYYFPSSTGKTFPNTQVLHTRACTDRFNGEEYGAEALASCKDSVNFYDFDLVHTAVVGPRLVFCKVCKKYQGDVLPGENAPNTGSHAGVHPPDDELFEWTGLDPAEPEDPDADLVRRMHSVTVQLPAPLDPCVPHVIAFLAMLTAGAGSQEEEEEEETELISLTPPPEQQEVITVYYASADPKLDISQVIAALQQRVPGVVLILFGPEDVIDHDAILLIFAPHASTDTTMELRALLPFQRVICLAKLLFICSTSPAAQKPVRTATLTAWYRRGLVDWVFRIDNTRVQADHHTQSEIENAVANIVAVSV